MDGHTGISCSITYEYCVSDGRDSRDDAGARSANGLGLGSVARAGGEGPWLFAAEMRSATYGSQSILEISEADMSALNSRFRDARSQVKTRTGTAPSASPDSWVGATPPERWTSPPFPRPASEWWAEWESQQGDFTDVLKILRRLLLATRPSEIAAKFGVPDAHALLKFDVFITGANPRPLARSVVLWDSLQQRLQRLPFPFY